MHALWLRSNWYFIWLETVKKSNSTPSLKVQFSVICSNVYFVWRINTHKEVKLLQYPYPNNLLPIPRLVKKYFQGGISSNSSKSGLEQNKRQNLWQVLLLALKCHYKNASWEKESMVLFQQIMLALWHSSYHKGFLNCLNLFECFQVQLEKYILTVCSNM